VGWLQEQTTTATRVSEDRRIFFIITGD